MTTHPSAAPSTAQGSKLLSLPKVGVPLANTGSAARWALSLALLLNFTELSPRK